MTRRKPLIALATAGAVASGLAVSGLPAVASHKIVVTLATGEKIEVAVPHDGRTPGEIQLPKIETPVGSVEQVPESEKKRDSPPEEDGTKERERRRTSPEKGKRKRPSGNRNTGPGTTTPGARTPSVKPRTPTRPVRRPVVPGRRADGVPTPTNPTFTLAEPGPAPIGVPNFFIDRFRIPIFLLRIYQAAGSEYGVPWQVLAAINEIETAFGTNLNVSTAGAVGWMQFLPSTWRMYGVDANRDGLKDPYNPMDAIFAAARYLRAAGADQNLRRAIYAYNHAWWYVDSVMLRANLIQRLPANLVGSLTGLTEGHFPVYAKARYADDLADHERERRVKRGQNAAYVIGADQRRKGISIYARRGAPVIAVHDGRIVRMGRSPRLGRFIQLQDAYGNTYTYGHLAKLARSYPVPKQREVSREEIAQELELPRRDPRPTAPATAGRSARPQRGKEASRSTATAPSRPRVAGKERLFAHPDRPKAYRAGGEQQILQHDGDLSRYTTFRTYFSKVFGLGRKDVQLRRLRPGAKVAAGTILGRIGKTSSTRAPHVLFEIRPAGRGAPRIDPKPILDGWKLLETTAIYRAAGRNPFVGPDAKTPTIGQILLMDRETLVARVLANPRIEMYDCGRRDVAARQIDRRVLATLEFLTARGLRPTVTSLKCGHSIYTKSGNVSHHSSGNAVDIAAINGVPILGHQGRDSITELAVRELLTLQGTMRPDQIITLMTFKGYDNTYAMGDHHDHIHIGWRPLYGTNTRAARQVNAVLQPGQWIKLIDRLNQIRQPKVRVKPSKYALKVKRASRAHRGE